MSLPNSPLALLNNLTPTEFLAEYWQKKPLLIRQAIPNFEGLLTPNELAGLACEETVEARIIQNKNDQWQVEDAPFDEDDFTSLPEKYWTLLVQSVNHHVPEAAELLSLFSFIPLARLDDLMISYAPTGGSVGAHLDSYDVFLLQGSGTRRWGISAQTDFTLVEDAPLRLLKHFKAEQEWVLSPGDMLYLPPNIAHRGVSEDDDCMTYSIGFRAPGKQELMQGFLEYLQDTVQAGGLYEDVDLGLQQHPAEISADMIAKVETILQKIKWDKSTISGFLGRVLTEPKVGVFFEPVDTDATGEVTIDNFSQALSEQTLWLDLQSILLFSSNHFYINGELLSVPANIQTCIQELADKRSLNTPLLNDAQRRMLAETLHAALLAGYIAVE
ncbi:MAG: cupin domain-containing protein [Methylophilaceae bacterium]|jgi:50S ribosomal protein L16 3-hydroxylase|nr:cupin domain-containing protein [Methylophilaceae bacterium]